MYLLDGGEEYRETLASTGEPAMPGTEWILNQAQQQTPYSVRETWKLNLERESFRARALSHWNATKNTSSTGRPVDAVICPAHPTLAVPHDGVRWWGYTSHWNLLDLPAVVFPVVVLLQKEVCQTKIPDIQDKNPEMTLRGK